MLGGKANAGSVTAMPISFLHWKRTLDSWIHSAPAATKGHLIKNKQKRSCHPTKE
jgi:hypothetical protein